MSLILNSLRSGPKTFTQLLQKTRLPRKTLSLRLKDLVNSETIVNDGRYRLNGALPSELWREMNLKRSFQFSRKNIMLTLLIFCMGILLAQAYGQHMIAPPQKLTITGTFEANLVISDATGLCAWQARVVFDPGVLVVIDVTEGSFLQGKENSFATIFVVNTQIVDDIFVQNDIDDPLTIINDEENGADNVFIACSLIGNSDGISGDGILATVTFGVIGQGSQGLHLEDVLLLDSALSEIPEDALALEQS